MSLNNEQLEYWVRTLSKAQDSACKLILVVGNSNTGKTKLLQQLAEAFNFPKLNLGIELTKRLLELDAKEVPHQAESLLNEVLTLTASPKVAVDNTELLFEPMLAMRPLEALKVAAQAKLLIVAWNGSLADKTLTFAFPGHPAHRSYKLSLHPEVMVIPTEVRI